MVAGIFGNHFSRVGQADQIDPIEAHRGPELLKVLDDRPSGIARQRRASVPSRRNALPGLLGQAAGEGLAVDLATLRPLLLLRIAGAIEPRIRQRRAALLEEDKVAATERRIDRADGRRDDLPARSAGHENDRIFGCAPGVADDRKRHADRPAARNVTILGRAQIAAFHRDAFRDLREPGAIDTFDVRRSGSNSQCGKQRAEHHPRVG